MNHGFSNDFLCAASKITSFFQSDDGSEIRLSGTGFFVQNSKKDIFFITNRHITDIAYHQLDVLKYKNHKLTKVSIESKIKDKETGLPNTDICIVINFETNKFVYDNEENDVAALKISASDLLIEFSKDKGIRIDYPIPYEMIADQNRIDNKLNVCDFVVFPGFPDWYDKKNNLPIMRTGTIASDPRFDYSYQSGQKNVRGNVIAYEAFSFGGSSGSPVFAAQKGIKTGPSLTGGDYREGMLIGINAGHLNDVKGHSGISYFYKSTVILKLIER